jgi:hypothetical protein
MSEFVCHAVYKDCLWLCETTIKYTKSNKLVLVGPRTQNERTYIESNIDALKVFEQIMSKTNYSETCYIKSS